MSSTSVTIIIDFQTRLGSHIELHKDSLLGVYLQKVS